MHQGIYDKKHGIFIEEATKRILHNALRKWLP